MITHGVEVVGFSGTHLLNARRCIAHAISPEGGARNPNLALYLADGARGSVDPAFDAHVLPIKHWALACWSQWQPAELLQFAMAKARDKVIVAGSAKWARVTGPAGATCASAHRLGWSFLSATSLVTDTGRMLNLVLDPPPSL